MPNINIPTSRPCTQVTLATKYQRSSDLHIMDVIRDIPTTGLLLPIKLNSSGYTADTSLQGKRVMHLISILLSPVLNNKKLFPLRYMYTICDQSLLICFHVSHI